MTTTTPAGTCGCCRLPSDDLKSTSVMAEALCPGCRGEAPLATLLQASAVRELGHLGSLQAAAGEGLALPTAAGAVLRL